VGEKEGWYSDREMFEMIQKLTVELTETRVAVRKYNGLWEKFDKVDRRLTAIEQRAKGRASVGIAIREWGGWVVGIVAVAAVFLKG